MTHQDETLNSVFAALRQQRLGEALGQLENYLLTHHNQADMERLVAVKDDYGLMTRYWQQGYADAQRPALYRQLLQRLYVLAANVALHATLRASAFLKSLHAQPRRQRSDWAASAVRASLEGFVSDIALAGLQEGDDATAAQRQLHADHQQLMRDLFDYIVTSRQWNDRLADVFSAILTTPTVDSRDQQLIVAALTLSVLQTFDPSKVRLLLDVYCTTDDEALRQRALVGWVVGLDADGLALFPQVAEAVADACADERCQQELTELQMQLVYCMEAEDDSDVIKNEIMPDLIKGSNIRVTRQGLVEVDEDTLDDILHPEASERNMERMEQSVRRMADMQKQGADIYFSGFSQMKRFPFFGSLSNWFVPFYTHHPAIADIWQNTRGKRFLQLITKLGAFCDSDKYSFVLAFDQVLNHLPKNMLQMVEQGEAVPMPVGGEVELEEQRQPAFVRRIYLQNLYRFYRLFPSRQDFPSPFATRKGETFGRHLFFAGATMQGLIGAAARCQVAAFLMKRRRYAEARAVLDRCDGDGRGYEWHMLMGNALLHLPEEPLAPAARCYREALALRPDSAKALAGYARAAFREQSYEASLDAYTRLLEQQPDHQGYQLNQAVCLTRLGRHDEAQQVLFRLNYLQPDDLSVCRVLAWTLTVSGKLQQAGRLYEQLLQAQPLVAADLLNNGYRLWFERNMEGAIGMFRQFADSTDGQRPDLETEFMVNEHDVIAANGIDDTEIRLMLDAI